MNLRNLECCGAREIIGINEANWTPKRWLLMYVDHFNLHHTPKGGCGFLPFCYAWDVRKVGAAYRTKRQGALRLEKWKKFIEENKLGEVHLMAPKGAYNPNYGTKVRLRSGIFIPNNKKIAKFVVKEGWRNVPKSIKDMW